MTFPPHSFILPTIPFRCDWTMSDWNTLSSAQDASVNHTLSTPDGGHWESRFVQRTSDYFICYLSSHTGCSHSCRFCHLTATGQTMMTPATVEDYLRQADKVLATYQKKLEEGQPAAQRLHFNFMSRGEALSNPHLLERSSELFQALGDRAQAFDLPARFLVSTILPRDFSADLSQVLADDRSHPYYSLYSVSPKFRKRWLPKALPAQEALALLADFQKQTGRKVVLHWAFIAGENDQQADVEATLDAVEASGLKAKFNLVRYNPHDARHGVEPSEERLQQLFDLIAGRLGQPGSRIVPRVGYDVKASCGMFIEPAGRARSIPLNVVAE